MTLRLPIPYTLSGRGVTDTHSPMTRINSIRMVLTIFALRNLELHHMDVKTDLLNRDLDEEIYMEQPEG